MLCPKFIAKIVVAGALLIPGHAAAEGISATVPMLYTGGSVEMIVVPTDDDTAYELLFTGSYSSGVFGARGTLPLGFVDGVGQDGLTRFVLGNIELAGTVGAAIDTGGVGLVFGGELAMALPTSSSDTSGPEPSRASANLVLTQANLLRPGLRLPAHMTFSPRFGLAVQFAIVELYTNLGLDVVVPVTDDTPGAVDGNAQTLLGAGVGVAFFPIPALEVVAEYALSQRINVENDVSDQLSTGLRVYFPPMRVGIDIRIPIREEVYGSGGGSPPLLFGAHLRFSM